VHFVALLGSYGATVSEAFWPKRAALAVGPLSPPSEFIGTLGGGVSREMAFSKIPSHSVDAPSGGVIFVAMGRVLGTGFRAKLEKVPGVTFLATARHVALELEPYMPEEIRVYSADGCQSIEFDVRKDVFFDSERDDQRWWTLSQGAASRLGVVALSVSRTLTLDGGIRVASPPSEVGGRYTESMSAAVVGGPCRLHYKANTAPGTSGAPLMVVQAGRRVVVGVHCGADPNLGLNFGSTLETLFQLLMGGLETSADKSKYASVQQQQELDDLVAAEFDTLEFKGKLYGRALKGNRVSVPWDLVEDDDGDIVFPDWVQRELAALEGPVDAHQFFTKTASREEDRRITLGNKIPRVFEGASAELTVDKMALRWAGEIEKSALPPDLKAECLRLLSSMKVMTAEALLERQAQDRVENERKQREIVARDQAEAARKRLEVETERQDLLAKLAAAKAAVKEEPVSPEPVKLEVRAEFLARKPITVVEDDSDQAGLPSEFIWGRDAALWASEHLASTLPETSERADLLRSLYRSYGFGWPAANWMAGISLKEALGLSSVPSSSKLDSALKSALGKKKITHDSVRRRIERLRILLFLHHLQVSGLEKVMD